MKPSGCVAVVSSRAGAPEQLGEVDGGDVHGNVRQAKARQGASHIQEVVELNPEMLMT
jgi:hypothetical protein